MHKILFAIITEIKDVILLQQQFLQKNPNAHDTDEFKKLDNIITGLFRALIVASEIVDPGTTKFFEYLSKHRNHIRILEINISLN
jgi:hypothetical protein